MEPLATLSWDALFAFAGAAEDSSDDPAACPAGAIGRTKNAPGTTYLFSLVALATQLG
jgi:hypothetical protein